MAVTVAAATTAVAAVVILAAGGSEIQILLVGFLRRTNFS